MEFAWGIVVALVCLLLAAPLNLVALTPGHFRASRVCFFLAAILLGGMSVVWQSLSSQPLWLRFVVGFAIFGLIGGGLPEGLRWVGTREKRSAIPTPAAESPTPPPSNRSESTLAENGAKSPSMVPGLKPKGHDDDRFSDQDVNATVSMGGDKKSLSSGAIENGSVRVYRESEGIFVDAVIFNGPNRPPIAVKHNRVPAEAWDRNFDSNALEIIAPTGEVVFQLIYATPKRIVVNGIFVLPDGSLRQFGDDAFVDRTFTPYKGLTPQRLFKYPSYKFQGQREAIASVVPRTLPVLKRDVLMLANDLEAFTKEQIEIINRSLGSKDMRDRLRAMRATQDLYDERFAFRCTRSVEEIRLSGVDVGRLPVLCKAAAGNPQAMQTICEELKKLALQLPD